MTDILRPYQREGITNIFNEWREGTRSVLFQMPTGTGKTVLFSEIVKMGHDKDRKILIVAHRKELIEQIIRKLQSKDIESGVIVAGQKSDYSKIVQVASIQTLNKRKHPDANLIIIDECHHAKAKSYKKLWDIYPDAKFLGVTATPIRLNGSGFDDLFDVLIPAMQINGFIEQGYLSKIKHLVCANPNLAGVRKQRGDYVTNMLKGVMLHNDLMSNLIGSYKKYAPDKSMIVFAVDVEHSRSIVERYENAGIAAAHVDSKTPPLQRKELLDAFKQGMIKIISNVEIITEGFDFPECEAVQLARPTKSLSLYLQMVGRVMRIAPDKKHGIVLDNAGLWLEHGFATLDREWTLKGTKENKEIKIAAVDDDGALKEIHKNYPQEAEGLELIELTEELERLLTFEHYTQTAINKEHKLISAFFKYKEYLESRNIQISKVEFDYCKKRLNKLNPTVNEDKRFKPAFWRIQESNLNFSRRDKAM